MSKSYFEIVDDKLYMPENISKDVVPTLYKIFMDTFSKSYYSVKKLDCSKITFIDSSGVAFIDEILNFYDLTPDSLENLNKEYNDKFKIFTVFGLLDSEKPKKLNYFESLGSNIYNFFKVSEEMLVLTSDIFYWAIHDLWDKTGRRKGSFTQQVNLIGINAIPIVALLSFIIGLILSLQSAVQLKQFGADQFLANLLAFSLVREMSPLITAIILAGRSGSSIASEIATMSVTEELDALKMMALNPIRFSIVPKFHAVTLVMALLVTTSILIGIWGGLLIAITIGGQSMISFITSCIDVVSFSDFVLSLIKSTIFAWEIVIIGSHYGLQVKGGAEGVGIATTKSVVASIFVVIITDAIFSLIYLV